MNRAEGRGAGQSLAELVDLELDPTRNRYEVPQDASQSGAEGDAADDDLWRRLEELAERQAALQDRQREQQTTLATEWELERLRRDLESLQDAMRNSSGQSGADESMERAAQALERASRAFAESPTMEDHADARDALDEARSSLIEQAHASRQARLDQAERRATNLLYDQRRINAALEAARAEALEAMSRDDDRPLFDFSMLRYVDKKLEMREELSSLRGELDRMSGDVGPAAADTLRQALTELDDGEVEALMSYAAEAFESGQHLYVIGEEAMVEQALERLVRRIRAAGQDHRIADAPAEDDALASARELRRALASAAADYEAGGSAEALADAARSIRGIARDAVSLQFALEMDAGDTYTMLGTSDANTATLVRMTAADLDRIETTLLQRDAPSIKAEAPRNAARDANAPARYFRALSTGEREGG